MIEDIVLIYSITNIRLHYYIMLNHETITKFIVSLTDEVTVNKVTRWQRRYLFGECKPRDSSRSW